MIIPRPTDTTVGGHSLCVCITRRSNTQTGGGCRRAMGRRSRPPPESAVHGMWVTHGERKTEGKGWMEGHTYSHHRQKEGGDDGENTHMHTQRAG